MTKRPASPLNPQPAADIPARADSEGSSMGMAGPVSYSEHWTDDAYHPQRSPGAYEWWYFEAIDEAGNGAVFVLFSGLPFYPPFLGNAASSYRRITKRPFDAPKPESLPTYYPAAYLGVFQGHQRVAQFLNLYPPGSLEGSTETPEIRVGPNRITLRADGSFGVVARGYPFDYTGGTPHPRRDHILSANLNFTPSFNGVQHVRPFRPQTAEGATHTWVIAAPHCRVNGRIQHIAESESVALLDMPLNCLGYHDHNYGQSLLGQGLKRLAWGHLVGPDFTVAWQRSSLSGLASSHAPTDAVLLFQLNAPPVIIESPTIKADHQHFTRWLIRYPGHTAHHGSDAQGNSTELLVNHDLTLETSPFHVRLAAQASLTVLGKRQYAGRGFTNILQLQRLRWPILSDAIYMATLQISTDDPLWRQ